MTKEEFKKKILEDPDFIKSYKYGNSLTKFLSKNTNHLENSAIARLLMISEEEVEEIYQNCVDFLKKGVVE